MKLIERFKEMNQQFKEINQLKRLNTRLNALETCLLTLTDLRLYLRKAEFDSCCRILPSQSFSTEIKYIDQFLEYVFAEEERYRHTKQVLLTKEESIKAEPKS